jgi:hypothetical protein
MRAIHADTLADSVGLCLHPENQYYRNFWNTIITSMIGAGVRHSRVGIGATPGTVLNWTDNDYIGKIAQLSNISKLCVVTAPGRTDLSKLEYYFTQSGGNWSAVEGPNEPNMTAGWGPGTAAWQKQLYVAVVNSSLLQSRGVKVAGPSLTGTGAGPRAIGDISSYVDLGNWHPYVNGLLPEHPVMDVYASDAKFVYGSKPLIATEFGYNNSLSQTRIAGAPDDVIAQYLPRAFLTNFSKGFIRSYWHQALTSNKPNTSDPQAGYGLASIDGSFGIKWTALRSFISTFNDIGPAYTPTDVDVTVTGGGAALRTMLLQKRDGTNLLALWQALPLWDTVACKYLVVPAQSVTITLPPGKTAARQLLFNSAGGVATTNLTVTNGAVATTALGALNVVQF